MCELGTKLKPNKKKHQEHMNEHGGRSVELNADSDSVDIDINHYEIPSVYDIVSMQKEVDIIH